jgi:AbrB family looped-hinge helix DNA binding protein
MGRTFKHMDLEQRLKIKEMLDSGYSVLDIAHNLGFHRSAIYRELEKGSSENGYNPHIAQEMYEKKLKNKGRTEIVLSNPDLQKYIADLILTEHFSPEKIVDLLAENSAFPDAPRSCSTIYSAIDKGLIPGVTRDSLLSKSSTVFSGGQICIPKWVLDKLNIKDGDILDLEITSNNEIVYKKNSDSKRMS